MEPDEQPAPPPEMILTAIMGASNIADLLPEERLAGVAQDVIREHRIDFDSMSEWRRLMERGLELASMIKAEKSYPFKDAANVKYPLITTAALQFNARAYPAIVPPDAPVKVRVHGADRTGQKAARAERVGQHMSWQVLHQIEEWECSIDEMLTVLPIVGMVVRKVWFDPVLARPRVKNITPSDFVINAAVKNLADAPRVGEVLRLFPSEIAERRLSGVFRDVEYVEVEGEDADAPQEFVEQHRRIDLDGDGYGEPYIVTVHIKSQKVARIVADFAAEDVTIGDAGVVAIRRGSYFVPFRFMPSLDGGFCGAGLGFLLGDISESINSIINMMMDAGHMASRGGGFIGSEFRIKGGSQQFQPGEWKMVQARGADVRSSIVPMTFPGPDATLFQLLGLLIEAGKEVASVSNVMTGDAPRQQTATTTLALIEQGMAVFTAAYKRIFGSLRHEFRLLARINAETLDPMQYSAFHDAMSEDGQPVMLDPQADYDLSDMDISPVADPTAVTRMQEAAKAQFVMELAQAGLVDPQEGVRRMLQAASIADAEALLPQPDPMAQQMQQMQAQAAQADLTLKMVAVDQALADLEKTRSETVRNMTDAAAKDASVRLDEAKMALEAVRYGIGQILGRGVGGMASAPGFGIGAGLPAPQPQPIQGGGGFGLLVGQPVAGSGSLGPVAAGGAF
jgi:chaperonin GroES